jgi:hypothetical protein
MTSMLKSVVDYRVADDDDWADDIDALVQMAALPATNSKRLHLNLRFL